MINRRQFIRQCAVLYGSLLFFPGCIPGTQKSAYRIFTSQEIDCLNSICEQFIPTDEYPGARDAGVVNFIDKLLYQRFPEQREPYRKGLLYLDNYCKHTFNKGFTQLSWDEQYALLQQMERGKLPEQFWQDISQQNFFNMVLRNTMQGYYGPPRHGGNKDFVSYRMMRLDFPLLIGQNRYE